MLLFETRKTRRTQERTMSLRHYTYKSVIIGATAFWAVAWCYDAKTQLSQLFLHTGGHCFWLQSIAQRSVGGQGVPQISKELVAFDPNGATDLTGSEHSILRPHSPPWALGQGESPDLVLKQEHLQPFLNLVQFVEAFLHFLYLWDKTSSFCYEL